MKGAAAEAGGGAVAKEPVARTGPAARTGTAARTGPAAAPAKPSAVPPPPPPPVPPSAGAMPEAPVVGRRKADGSPRTDDRHRSSASSMHSLTNGSGMCIGSGTSPGPGRVTGRGGAGVRPVLPRAESDDLSLRLQHAVIGFVDDPRVSVEEADAILEEAAAQFAAALAERRRILRNAWHGPADPSAAQSGMPAEAGTSGSNGTTPSNDNSDGNASGHIGTEELRTALRDYRDLVQRLLKV
ncbi:hypothetical protein [Streptomyces sp. NPDC048639]|uniref:hypothetical protein n=1 Tax=Streptomyces sp. NPDC048639 TaxID=3365581 RepID=UPI00371BDE0F